MVIYISLLALFPLVIIFFKEKSILRTLICLECRALVLVLSVLFIKGTVIVKLPIFFLMVLSFRACEGAIGLRLLVRNLRSVGNEFLNVLRIIKC